MIENNLKKLVSFDTESRKSNLELIEFAKKKFGEQGYDVEILKFGNKANLFAKKGSEKSRIILAAHTDTVPASSDWETSPLKLAISEKYYRGLGVCDMKGFISIMFEVAKKIENKENVAFLLTFDEETDFSGAKKITKKMIRPTDTVIIGEPTNNRIIFDSKGVGAYKVLFKGIGAHGSNPGKGRSAIIDCAKFIYELTIQFKKLSKKFKNIDFENPNPTLNFGKISGGDAINKVADECILKLETRMMDSKYLKKFEKLMVSIAKDVGAKIEVEKTLTLNPFSASGSIRKKVVGIEASKGVSYACEASFYNQFSKNCVVFGPGKIEDAHAPDESIGIEEIDKYTKKVYNLISQISP